MAVNNGPYWTIPGLIASSTLSGKQFYPVKLSSTAGTVTLCSAATDAVIGVLMNDPGTGQEAEVAFAGLVKVACEASLTAGTFVAASSTGRAKTTTTGNDDAFGKLVDGATSAGDLARVILAPSNY